MDPGQTAWRGSRQGQLITIINIIYHYGFWWYNFWSGNSKSLKWMSVRSAPPRRRCARTGCSVKSVKIVSLISLTVVLLQECFYKKILQGLQRLLNGQCPSRVTFSKSCHFLWCHDFSISISHKLSSVSLFGKPLFEMCCFQIGIARNRGERESPFAL